jgi:acetyl-CoA carboxylase carboxyl transferase subunit alpha
MQYTWYSVISPESCSSILWRTWEKKELAAEALKLSATDMLGNGLVDGIIPEPLGGAHHDPEVAYQNIKQAILSSLDELSDMDSEERISKRIDKFSRMGVVVE